MGESHCLQYTKTDNVYQMQNKNSWDNVQGHLGGGDGTQHQDPNCQGLDVPLKTLSTWLKKADDYKKAYETQGFGLYNKRMKKANFEDVDDAVDAWMR